MNTENLTEITWQDVRKGDLLMHESGDRLTVRGVGERISVAGLSLGATTWQALGFIPHRRKPEMPKQPGAYLDKDGDLVELFDDEISPWYDGTEWRSAVEMEHRAPFTRLVPMPTEEQVLEAVAGLEDWFSVVATSATERVMALLTGKEADSE